MNNGNGKDAAAGIGDVDPVSRMQSRLLMTARKVEEIFGGSEITLFIADPENPTQFNHVTTAKGDNHIVTLATFMAEQRKLNEKG